MALFGKMSIDESRLEYIKSIRKLGSTCDLLVSYAENTEHLTKMKELAEEVKYFLPIEKDSIKDIDKKVSNVLGDLKILVYTNGDPYRVEGKIKELDKLIDERNSKI